MKFGIKHRNRKFDGFKIPFRKWKKGEKSVNKLVKNIDFVNKAFQFQRPEYRKQAT